MSDTTDLRTVQGRIAQQLQIADAAIQTAKDIADTNEVDFRWAAPWGETHHYAPIGWESSQRCWPEEGWDSSSMDC